MKDLKSLIIKIKNLYSIFDSKRKFQLLFILLINLFNGFLEYLTLLAVSLFLNALSNPDSIIENKEISRLININVYEPRQVVFYSTLIFILVILFSSVVRIINLWINMKYRTQLIIFLETKAFSQITNQEYSYHIKTNSSDLLTVLTTDIEKTNFFIENFQTLITSLFIGLSITSGLINLNAKITLFSIFLFLILYTILGNYTNKNIKKYSKKESKANSDLIRRIIESLGSIRELILSGNQSFVLNSFNQSSNLLRTNQGYSSFITTFSRFAFEGIGLLIIAIIGYSIFNEPDNGNNVIALLGTFALGSLKLLPTMQSIYRSYSLLYFYEKPLGKVLKILYLKTKPKFDDDNFENFFSNIKLQNISFSFEGSSKLILNNISFTISKGEKVGIIGETGSGKTTLINILMGLLEPTKGNIKIDDREVFKINDDTRINWFKNITLVPQEIFLYDSSIYENIAFNINYGDINKEYVEKASKIACAHDFIKDRAFKYDTLTGEKGIQFSGGQKQRIGIARAIYRDTPVMILDEATNALDKKTEERVMKALMKIKDKTIISIAHRLLTLQNFDKIIELENGKIKKIFSGEDLKKKLKSNNL